MLKTIRTPSPGSEERRLGIQAAPLPWLLKYVDNNKINYTYQCLLANFPQYKKIPQKSQKHSFPSESSSPECEPTHPRLPGERKQAL